jgi:hypothetical protein
MARGGFRPGSGRKKKLRINDKAKKPENVLPEDANGDKALKDMTPLEFMLAIMNDPEEDNDRRDHMAIAAAPYCHARGGEKGKKDEQKNKARAAGNGKFASGRPPLRLITDKGKNNE